ncbi:PCNA-interacting partner [Erpetoichthys calabaricus]|uniref:PCNA-interacting partner n=1 Tax=Erpetoichthys calabaricus TaxID=27687 RepID=UPI002233F12C|nr:PCNA-interacting partner [Erpetoichthys calabaricus]
MDIIQKNLRNIVKVFRRECHRAVESERTTICSADEMIRILQLCMAQINKQEYGEFTVALSDLLIVWKHLIKDKLGLLDDNSSVPDNYEAIQRLYDSFLKNSNTVDLIDVCTMYDNLKMEGDPVCLLSSLQIFQFLSWDTNVCTNMKDTNILETPSHANRASSETTAKIKRLICAYLSLLVNSKNDMALAYVLNIPERGLGKEAFTDLKHAANSKKTSLFLAATSFIRTIQLGGKGYAPPDDDPLRKHIKGLSDFVHFMDILDEILGETKEPSLAGSCIISAIKTRLIKGRSSGDQFCSALEETIQELKMQIKDVIFSEKCERNISTTGISPARPKAYAINHSTAYGGRETVKVLLMLLDQEATIFPKKNKANFLHAVEDDSEIAGQASVLALYKSPEPSAGTLTKSLRHRVEERRKRDQSKVKMNSLKSQFACTYNDNSENSTTLKTAIVSLHSVDENSTETGVFTVENESLVIKRLAFGPISGNAQQRGNMRNKGSGNSNSQPGNKSCKRKQVDVNSVSGNCSHENEPPQKKAIRGPEASEKPQNKFDGKPGAPGKSSKTTAKKKLIAGQGKLTNFFRL